MIPKEKINILFNHLKYLSSNYQKSFNKTPSFNSYNTYSNYKKNKPLSSTSTNKLKKQQQQPVNIKSLLTMSSDEYQPESTTNAQNDSLKKILFDLDSKFESYDEELIYRRLQANKSILIKFDFKIQVQSVIENINFNSLENVFIFLSSDNKINALVEFQTEQKMNNFLNQKCRHFNSNSKYWPTTTRIIFSLHKNPNNVKSNINSLYESLIHDLTKQNIQNSINFKDVNLNRNSSQQIKEFYDRNKIDEINYRIRFFVASLVEEPIRGLFKYATCLPFGSSMNKFGSKTSDLDLSLTLNNKHLFDMSKHFKSEAANDNHYRFFYMTKICENRATKKNDLFDYVEFLVNRMCRFTRKQSIRNARVPIIKFDFDLNPKLNCDISISSQHMSYQMTKLLWTYYQMDERVAPLIFVVRFWAKIVGITTSIRPSPNLTNYHIAILVLNFLIRLDNSFVLPLDSIASQCDSQKPKNYEDDEPINYIINDVKVSKLRQELKKSNNTIVLGELFHMFFKYYANFNHFTTEISLKKELKTNDKAQLVIENPISIGVNTAVNVNNEHARLFIQNCSNSYKIIKQLKLANKKDYEDYNLNKFFDLVTENRVQSSRFYDEMNI
jgi:DNA polymerase sigma